jgi:hypothetical protein
VDLAVFHFEFNFDPRCLLYYRIKLKMDFRLINMKHLLFLAGAVAAVSCAQAQSVMQPGQPIIFSSPGNDDASNAPTLAAPSPVASGFPDASQPPLFNFGAMPPRNVRLPAPQATAAAAAPGDFERLQKLLDERKNWALLTPAEVIGIPTPEKILGLPERDASGQEKNLTVTERYYERQNRLQTGRTNDYQNNLASRWNLPDGQNDDRLNADSFNPKNAGFGNPAQNADSFFGDNAPANNNAVASQKPDAGSGDFFAAPTRLTPAATAANLEQQAEMERFRQLLDPPPQPAAAAKHSSGESVFSLPHTEQNSLFGQTPANPNPIGGSFTPLGSGIGGLPASPGQNNTPPITVTPSWAPQPPPWLSPTPQPGQIPQRKF